MNRFKMLLVPVVAGAFVLSMAAAGQSTTAQVAASIPLNVPATALVQLPDSRLGGKDLLASGSLRGFSSTQSKHVYAAAWPTGKILAKMKPGSTFTLLPVAQATVAADGSYRLYADRSKVAKEYVASDGQIDLTIVA